MSDLKPRIPTGVALMVGSLLLAVALVIGLMAVGRGVSVRGSNTGITITGEASASVSANQVIWTLTAQEIAPTAQEAVSEVAADVKSLSAYLQRGGIDVSKLVLSGVSTSDNEQYINGNPTGKILNYQASRNVTVNSDNVYLIQKLSQGIGQVLETGANIDSSGPQYYVSTLQKLRPRLIAAAMRDAKARAIALVSATGGTVGSVRSARSGPFQVNAVGSVEVSSGGVYDTTTIRKTVSTTVTVVFNLN
ncbi:MAG TPA: SIMPL domain-containing protein [Acidimicrobiales bacterium]|nr:SIMPL domain-containing protein [Acidimicrobiales bacterium]